MKRPRCGTGSDRDEPADDADGDGGFWRLGVACLLALMGGAGCFGNATPSMRPAEDSTAALPQAKAGDAGALHRSFRAAFAEEMRPFPNTGEPAREISDNLDAILLAVGDNTFADALLKERPPIRSAVRDCMVEGDIQKQYPRTYEVFEDAPQNEWPSDRDTRHGNGEEGEPEPAPPPEDSQ